MTSPVPRDVQLGAHDPVKLLTKVVSIYLLSVIYFQTAGLAGARVCDGSSHSSNCVLNARLPIVSPVS